MDWHQRIVVDPAVLVGKPILRGTRIPVQFVLELLAGGWSAKQILENYPGLTEDDVRACLAYAAERLESERVFPVATG